MTEPQDAEDYTDSDDEGADGYRNGGYHAVTVGEVYNNRYAVIAKLGWGHFSTVWLCQDIRYQRYVAMKVQKSAPHYTEAAYDEIELLAAAAKRGNAPEWESTQRGPLHDVFPCQPFTGVVQLIDYFEHVGPNGKHVCMVFETMGPNVLALIKRYNFKGVPLQIVRKVAQHVLIGLDYLHRVCGIIHTDLKPENILVACPRGVPVNKNGVPLVGNVDPAILAQKAQTMSEKLFQVKHETSKAKGDKKKGKKKKAEKNGDDAADDGNEVAVVTAEEKPKTEDGLKKKGLIEPPYMKPLLKPTRSDPTLLSSYGDDKMMMKMPYHHLMQDPQAFLDSQSFSAGSAAAALAGVGAGVVAGGYPARTTGSKTQGAQDGVLSPKLLDEVAALDLFDHPDVMFKVADLGNACWTEKHFSDDIQTRQYRSPETIINAGYDTSADMWSLACMLFELVTGDYLFDPKASEEYPRDEDHLALFNELLGSMPKPLIARGRRSSTYFNKKGDLRHIKSLRFWGLDDVLQQKYHMNAFEAKNLASFLGPMLRLAPEERSHAHQLLTHPWLRGLPSPEVTEACSRLTAQPALAAPEDPDSPSRRSLTIQQEGPASPPRESGRESGRQPEKTDAEKTDRSDEKRSDGREGRS